MTQPLPSSGSTNWYAWASWLHNEVTTGSGGDAENVVVHGDTASVARPVTASPVIWFGTVEPVNADDTLDVWVVVNSQGSTGVSLGVVSGSGLVDAHKLTQAAYDALGAGRPSGRIYFIV